MLMVMKNGFLLDVLNLKLRFYSFKIFKYLNILK